MNTKHILAKALMELLNKNNFESITVQMILNESSVSRTTFYRLFRDKHDLMVWYYCSYVENLLHDNQTWHNFFQEVFQFIHDNHKFFYKLLSVHDDNSFWKFFYNFSYSVSEIAYLKKINRTQLTERETVELGFYIAGNVFTVEEWVRNGVKIPVIDIVDWVCQLMPDKYRCLKN